MEKQEIEQQIFNLFNITRVFGFVKCVQNPDDDFWEMHFFDISRDICIRINPRPDEIGTVYASIRKYLKIKSTEVLVSKTLFEGKILLSDTVFMGDLLERIMD